MSESEPDLDAADQRRAVRERYARIAREADADADAGSRSDDGGCCDGGSDDPDDVGTGADTDERARQLGYSGDDVDAAGEANLGLGCGNPNAIASLEPGETVLDATLGFPLGGGASAKLKATNLLDADFRFEQEANGITQVQRLYSTGRTFSVGLSWEF